MTEQIFPTKGNLIKARKDLALSRLGYELMDRKRNILVRELMQLVDAAKEIRVSIEQTYVEAYSALQEANISLGVIEKFAQAVPVETSLKVEYRSVMGVEIPTVMIEEIIPPAPFGFYDTDVHIDKAYILFIKVKQMTAHLAEVENSIYRLAHAIKKTQKRANALKNILIPKFEGISKYITDSLEEKEREEFSRLKVIKRQKNLKSQIVKNGEK
ncbi:MAG: V-type ATP synthase subunit D [Oscillospiraceae bacterium]|nr:V-type ATP synthase subunit D [Oscillospiraceae bacterium]